MKEQKDKKGKKINYIRFNYSEEFITNIEKPTKEDLKNIFNKKYFNYIRWFITSGSSPPVILAEDVRYKTGRTTCGSTKTKLPSLT